MNSMTTFADDSNIRKGCQMQLDYALDTARSGPDAEYIAALPASITRSASRQTYYTIGYLVDRDLREDAYRAYAYFRWVDDCLDEKLSEKFERIAFVERQQAIVDRCYRGEWPTDVTIVERMLVDLIRNDPAWNSGLQSYIRNMIAVMAFDANRRGRLISDDELTEYTSHLATAVTEALHYFIGHNDPPPYSTTRYLAVTAAHITHMLRDTRHDTDSGYFNITRNFLEAVGGDPCDLWSDPYRAWVQSRVELARQYFRAGKKYLAQVKNFRCRLAGYAYIARFEGVLTAIERDEYRLRAEYPESKSLTALVRMVWSAGSGSLGLAANLKLSAPS
jgi:Squalene/phytoene synthase